MCTETELEIIEKKKQIIVNENALKVIRLINILCEFYSSSDFDIYVGLLLKSSYSLITASRQFYV